METTLQRNITTSKGSWFTTESSRSKLANYFLELVGSFCFVFLLLLPNVMLVADKGTFGSFFNTIQNTIPLLALYNASIIWLVLLNSREHLGLKITSGGAISVHRKGNLDVKKTHEVLIMILFQLIGAFIASYCGFLISSSRGTWTETSNLTAIQSSINGFMIRQNGTQNLGIVFWFLPIQIFINLVKVLTVGRTAKELQPFTTKTNWPNNFKWLGILYIMAVISLIFNAQNGSTNGIMSNSIMAYAMGGQNTLFTMFAVTTGQYALAIFLLNNSVVRGNLN